MIFNLWMKNRMQYYKRIYKTIQDVISDIGGISEFITIIASYINSLYNNYNSLHNFQNLISPYIKKNNKNINSDNEFQNLNRIKIKKYESNKYENTDIERNNSNNKILDKQNNLNPNPHINKEKEAKDDLTIFKNKDIENINNEKIDNFIKFL